MDNEQEVGWGQPFDALHVPSHCKALDVEEELTTVYEGGRVEKRRRTIRCWYDQYLGRFSTEWGTLRGVVLRWKKVE